MFLRRAVFIVLRIKQNFCAMNASKLSFLPLLAAVFLILSSACDVLEDKVRGEGLLHFSLDGPGVTKAGVPDSSAYLLKVVSSSGNIIYDGQYGAAPSAISVPAGNYTVSVRSCLFNPPSFSTPLYGDDQVVSVPAGESVNVHLNCTLLNCGVRLDIDSSFLTGAEQGALLLRCPEGSVMYGYTEDRIAFFNPGDVSLVLSSYGSDKTLMTRSLSAREILRLKVFSKSGGSSFGSGITVATDTSAVWLDDTFVIGSSPMYDVATARTMTGAEGVWVYGYIVGCASPFLGTSSDTNLAISGRTTATGKDECLSVELVKGALRDALNLVSHPSYLGRKVFLKGNITTYYSMPGIKKITDWSLDTPPDQ